MQKLSQQMKNNKKVIIAMVAILLLATLIELFLFNFRHFESLFFSPVTLTNPVVGEGFVTEGENTYRRQSQGEDAMSLTYEDVNMPIYNIYCNVRSATAPGNDIFINFEITDASHKYYYQMPTAVVWDTVEQSKYYRLHLNGETNDLQLIFSAVNHDEVMVVDDIVINAKVPLSFSFTRFFIVLFLLFAGYALRPKSRIYTFRIGKKTPATRGMIAIIVLMVLCAVWIFWLLGTNSNPQMIENAGMNQQNFFVQQVQSILNGYLHLDIPVSEELLAHPYPYDITVRGAGEFEYVWDLSFYDGQYYMYFGPLPSFLFALPYLLITGMALPLYIMNFLFSSMFAAGMFFLMYQIVRKFFTDIPFVTYLLLSVFMLAGSNIFFSAEEPSVYNVAITSAMSMCALGFGFWIMSLGEEKLHTVPLCLGSLFVALVVWCRPSVLLLGFFALPLFWGRMFKDRQLFSKQSIVKTVCFVAPVAVIAVMAMTYNYLRFDSVLDFGHKFLLSSTDLSIRTFVPENIGRTLFYSFLQPPVFSGAFPYLQPAVYSPGIMYDVFIEPIFGGVLMCFPMLWCLPMAVYYKKELTQRRLYPIILALLGSGVVLAYVAVHNAGLTQRYVGEFFTVMCLAAVLLILFLTEQMQSGRKRIFIRNFVLFGVACAIGYAACLVFSVAGGPFPSIKTTNPELFYTVQRAVQFWM